MDLKLSQVEFAHNHFVNKSRGSCPFEAVYSSLLEGPSGLIAARVSGCV